MKILLKNQLKKSNSKTQEDKILLVIGLFQKISATVHAKCTNQPTKANRPARRWLEAVAGPDTVTRRASALARSTVETGEETHPSVKIPSLHIEDLIFCR